MVGLAELKLVELPTAWDEKGSPETLGLSPYGEVTPDVDGFGASLADRMMGPDPTVAPKQVFNPPLPLH